MKRTYTQTGKRYTEGKKTELNGMFKRLKWQAIPCEMAAMPGMGIKEVIKQLHIPKVSHVSASHELAPYGLMGIKAHYKNGDAIIYIIDTGCECIVLASDFYAS